MAKAKHRIRPQQSERWIETFMASLAVRIGLAPTVAAGQRLHRQNVAAAEMPARRRQRFRVLDGGRDVPRGRAFAITSKGQP